MQWKWRFDTTLDWLETNTGSGTQYVAEKIQGGTGDWVYQIKQIDSNGKEIAVVGTVVVDRPTDTTDPEIRSREVRQNIKAKIDEYEQQTMQVAKI